MELVFPGQCSGPGGWFIITTLSCPQRQVVPETDDGAHIHESFTICGRKWRLLSCWMSSLEENSTKREADELWTCVDCDKTAVGVLLEYCLEDKGSRLRNEDTLDSMVSCLWVHPLCLGKSIFLRGRALVPGMEAEKSVYSFTLFPSRSDSDAWWWLGQQWWDRCQQRCLMSGSRGPGAGGGHRNRWGCRVGRGRGSWRGFALLKCTQLKIEYWTSPTFTVFTGLCHFGWPSSLRPSPLSLEVSTPFPPSLCQGFATFPHLLKTCLGYFFIPNGLI